MSAMTGTAADSGFTAAAGLVDGARATAYASDPTIQGGAMGSAGCKAILVAYEHAPAEQVPVIGLLHSGGARPSLRRRARGRPDRRRRVRRGPTAGLAARRPGRA